MKTVCKFCGCERVNVRLMGKSETFDSYRAIEGTIKLPTPEYEYRCADCGEASFNPADIFDVEKNLFTPGTRVKNWHGTEYIIEQIVKSASNKNAGEKVVIYKNCGGSYARPLKEFYDKIDEYGHRRFTVI